MMTSTLQPDNMGSYAREDVIFLLRDIGNVFLEMGNEKREQLIQAGTHYSEMLPMEYQPSKTYMKLFYKTLDAFADRIAIAVGVVAERIVKSRGLENLILVSLARAGTPIGILIKRYISMNYKVDVPHYSISILCVVVDLMRRRYVTFFQNIFKAVFNLLMVGREKAL